MREPLAQHRGRRHPREHRQFVKGPDRIAAVSIADEINRHAIPGIRGIAEFRIVGKERGITELVEVPGSQRIRCLGNREDDRIDPGARARRIPELRHHPALRRRIVPGNAVAPAVIRSPRQLIHEGLHLQRAAPLVEDLEEGTAAAAIYHLNDVIRPDCQRRIRRRNIGGTNPFDVLLHDTSTRLDRTRRRFRSIRQRFNGSRDPVIPLPQGIRSLMARSVAGEFRLLKVPCMDQSNAVARRNIDPG